MKLGMMETSKEQPSVVIQSPQAQIAPEASSSQKKKYATIAVTVTCVTALMVTGFVTAFYFYSRTTDNIIKHKTSFQDHDGNEVMEDIEADLIENVAYFSVDHGVQGIHHILQDYNRKLSTTKIVKNGETTCYVHALNTSMTAVDVVSGKNMDSPKDSPSTFTLDPSPISNTDFLAPKAVSMCQGIPIHWAIPACINNEMTKEEYEDKRSKRQAYQCAWGCCLYLCADRVDLVVYADYAGNQLCDFTWQGYIGHHWYC